MVLEKISSFIRNGGRGCLNISSRLKHLQRPHLCKSSLAGTGCVNKLYLHSLCWGHRTTPIRISHPLFGQVFYIPHHSFCSEQGVIIPSKIEKKVRKRPFGGVNTDVLAWCSNIETLSAQAGSVTGNSIRDVRDGESITPAEIEATALDHLRSGHLSYSKTFLTIRFCILVKRYICHDLVEFLLTNSSKVLNSNSDSDTIAQLMFCVYINGGAPDFTFKEVENILENGLSNYSHMQALMILKAWNRCFKKFNSDKVMEHFWNHFCDCIDENQSISAASSHNEYVVLMYVKHIGPFEAVLRSTQQLDVIGNIGYHFPEGTHLGRFVPICKILTKARFYHQRFISRLIREIDHFVTEKSVHITERKKIISDLCLFLSQFCIVTKNDIPDDTCPFENLIKLYRVSRSTGKQSLLEYPILLVSDKGQKMKDQIYFQKGDPIINFAMGLAMAGKLPPEFLNDILLHTIAESSLGPRQIGLVENWDPVQLLILQAYAAIECPNYTGSKLSQKMVKRLEKYRENEVKSLPKYEYLQKLVWNAVCNLIMRRCIHYHYILPGLNQVIEIRLDEKNKPSSFNPVPYYKLPMEASTTRIAIVICNIRQTTCNGNDMMGRLSLQVRQLQKLRYTVITVPIMSRTSLMRRDAERVMTEFLQQELEQTCGVILQNVTIPRDNLAHLTGWNNL